MGKHDDDYTTMTDDNDIDEILDDRRPGSDNDYQTWGPDLSRWNEEDDEDVLAT